LKFSAFKEEKNAQVKASPRNGPGKWRLSEDSILFYALPHGTNTTIIQNENPYDVLGAGNEKEEEVHTAHQRDKNLSWKN